VGPSEGPSEEYQRTVGLDGRMVAYRGRWTLDRIGWAVRGGVCEGKGEEGDDLKRCCNIDALGFEV